MGSPIFGVGFGGLATSVPLREPGTGNLDLNPDLAIMTMFQL